jgi:UDP-N-acetylglucosamine 1-carboxyvinyltransferase
MDRLRIVGGTPLFGSVDISGAKNAALPILFASILTNEKSIIHNVPLLADINTTIKVLDSLGLKTLYKIDNHTMEIDGSSLNAHEAPYKLVSTMRASVLVLGPLLARKGIARVSLPGGCAIGARPVDIHLAALEKMGAIFKIENGYIDGSAPNGLKGAKIEFSFPSVGATENTLMACVLAKGNSEIHNAAREPEIVDLVIALRSMGAKISGEGTSTIYIEGVPSLRGMKHKVAPDRIEAMTFLCAGLITKGKVTVNGISIDFMSNALDLLAKAGAKITSSSSSITAEFVNELKTLEIVTEPFPGFPTDMQAQFMALLTQANGISKISETIFENRFMHVAELIRLGAKIKVKGSEAEVSGPVNLTGATVMATDLRASACLIIAGLAAEGETIISRVYHLDRGYEQIELKLSKLGAKISREKDK